MLPNLLQVTPSAKTKFPAKNCNGWSRSFGAIQGLERGGKVREATPGPYKSRKIEEAEVVSLSSFSVVLAKSISCNFPF